MAGLEELERYARTRDAEAFSAVVGAYQDMVYGVCLRVLGNSADAEDAAQDCFLALARKAGSVRSSLAGWLHRRATHHSINLARQSAARGRREREYGEMRSAELDEKGEGASWREIAPEVDRAMDELPEDMRVALVEHFLRRRSQAEIARELGVSAATVSRRVDSGVERLREKLKGAGVIVPAALLALLLAENASAAAAPAALAAALGKMAIAGVGKGAGAAAGKAAALGLGAVKMKAAAGVAAVAAVAVGGLLTYAHLSSEKPSPEPRTGEAAPPEQTPAPEPPPPEPRRDEAPQKVADEKPPHTDLYGDPLPRFALARLGTVRLRHGDAVRSSLVFSPDGEKIASGGNDGTVRVWNAATGRERLRVRGRWAAWSPDGRLLAAGERKGPGVSLWDTAGRREVLRIRGARRPVGFSADGRLLVADSDYSGIVQVWDLEAGNELRMIALPGQSVGRVEFCSSGEELLLAGASWMRRGPIHVWDVASGAEIASFRHDHEHYVATIAVSPDGRLVASAGDGVGVWEVATGARRLRTPARPRDELDACLAFSPDGKTLASGGEEVVLWDLATGTKRSTLPGRGSAGERLAFSPDGGTLAIGTHDGAIRLWDVRQGRWLQRRPPASGLYSVAFSPDGKLVATGSSSPDKSISFWDPATGRELSRIEGHEGWKLAVAYSPDGKTLASACGKAARVWDSARRTELLRIDLPGSVRCVAYSPDGGRLATSDSDRTARLHDAASGREILSLGGKNGHPVFSPDGGMLATARPYQYKVTSATVCLWDAKMGLALFEMPPPAGYRVLSVECVAFSPDGGMIAAGARATPMGSGGDEALILRWDVPTREALPPLRGHARTINSVAFSPDGLILASGSDDRTVRLWDVAEARQLVVLEGHVKAVESVAFSPNGATLASVSRDTTGLIWDVAAALAGADAAEDWSTAAGGAATRAAPLPDSPAVRVIPAEDPAWRNELPWLLRRPLSFEFTGTPLREEITWLEAATGARITLDERVAVEAKRQTRISVQVTNMGFGLALEWALRPRGLGYVLRDNEVYVSTLDGVAEELRRQIAAGKRPNWKAELRERLDRRHSIEYRDDRTVANIVRDGWAGIKVELDPAVLRTRGGTKVKLGGIELEGTRGEILRRILDLAGLDYVLRDAAIYVSTPERLRALREKDAAPGPSHPPGRNGF